MILTPEWQTEEREVDEWLAGGEGEALPLEETLAELRKLVCHGKMATLAEE